MASNRAWKKRVLNAALTHGVLTAGLVFVIPLVLGFLHGSWLHQFLKDVAVSADSELGWELPSALSTTLESLGFPPTWTSTIVAVIIVCSIVSFVLKLIPRKVYCSDCGQFLGGDSSYEMPCPKCNGNIFSYHFQGAGHTIKNR